MCVRVCVCVCADTYSYLHTHYIVGYPNDLIPGPFALQTWIEVSRHLASPGTLRLVFGVAEAGPYSRFQED